MRVYKVSFSIYSVLINTLLLDYVASILWSIFTDTTDTLIY